MAGIEKISRLVNWDDLSIFLAISKTGSISKAAALLGRTQPTISKRVENLEYRLGAPLFTRTTSGMVATEIGKEILAHAVAMNRAATRIERMATGFDNAATGDVVIQCLDGLSADWIVPKVADFQLDNPKINLNFCHQTSEAPAPQKEPDLLVQFNTEKPMDFVATPLGSLHYVPMVSRGYRERHGIPKTMEDVVNYHLMYLRRSGLVVDTWEKKSRALRDLVTPNLSANSCAVILSAVLNGAGVSMLPTYLAKQHPDLLLLDYGIIYTYNFWLVQSPHASRLTRVQTVSKWMESIFDSTKNPWFHSDYISPSEFCDIEIIQPH
jgi:DNA-binding transcriptional LysR family regulator